MKIKLWGARGSIPTPGESTTRYGGNTTCVEVRSKDDSLLILDAGSGIRLLGNTLTEENQRIDLLLTHLHFDHIIGLGFFAPLFMPEKELHIWGPPSTTMCLSERLAHYLSPPLFPVRLRELDCNLSLHNVPIGDFEIGPFKIKTDLICHPGTTVGYRISEGDVSMTFIPDHEPALGYKKFPDSAEWTSGFSLAHGTDLLIHDAQYSEEEYSNCIGWGHSSMEHALKFAELTGVKRFVAFHHDPTHSDERLDADIKKAQALNFPFTIESGIEGATYQI